MFIKESSDKLCRDAMDKMRSPHQMKIICIDITNKCDLACSNCTRLLENQDTLWDMTLDNFRLACKSLADFPGIVAIIGGNPAMHKNFKELCEIFIEERPDKSLRGLWTNNVFKHNDLADDTFGIFNLNPHGVERGIKSLSKLKDKGWYHEGNSHHSPLLTAGKDVFAQEEMWDRISKCDVNHEWSASIVQNKGKIRAYFCEVAASFDLARGTDNGIEPVPGWWRRHISEFDGQVKKFCPGCGVPTKLKGHMDWENTDTFTKTNADLAAKSKVKGRQVVELLEAANAKSIDHKVTYYSEKLQNEDHQVGENDLSALIGDQVLEVNRSTKRSWRNKIRSLWN